MSITLRIANENDIESLVELLEELGYEVDKRVLPQRLDHIRTQGGEVIVAELDSVVVGCVNAIIDIRLAEGQNGELVSLVVSAAHQGRGVGKKLAAYAESWLKNKGCHTVRVRANVIREEAHLFYAGLGFQEIKAQKIFNKNTE